MYHIPNDRRAVRSALKIYDVLMDTLDHMDLSSIPICELERRGISRATFYRLFDNISDVLEWKCEMMMSEAISKAGKESHESFTAVLLSFISSILENKKLISTLASASKTYILYDLHMRHMKEIEDIFFGGMELNETDKVCITSLLAAMIPALCNLCLLYPEGSSAEILTYMKAALSRLDTALKI